MLWITGCRGLLGSALKDLPVHHVGTGKEVDISDLDAVLKFVRQHKGITHIVNCAAFSQVDVAEQKYEEAFRTNAIGPENLAIAAGEVGARLIHISTDYVFSGTNKRPFREDDPADPCNTYGRTKLEGEQRALSHGACIIRTSWIFGRGGKNFIGQLLHRLQSQKEISLTQDQWGRFTYAPDLAGAILKMLDQKKGCYHFANAGVTTKYEFGIAMREEAIAMGFPIQTDVILPVSGSSFSSSCKRPVYSALDTSKIETIVPVRHWRTGLKEFLCAQMPACS